MKPKKKPNRWEYHWVRLPLYEGSGVLHYDVDLLDELGAEGWEAYAVTSADALEERQIMFHLRRPVPLAGEGPCK